MARWGKIGSRGNVEDRRGQRMAVGGLAGGGIVGVLMLLAFSFLGGGGGIDLNSVLNQLQTAQAPTSQIDSSEFEGNDEYEQFASTVLGSNNDVWEQVFANAGDTYEAPRLVLFRDATRSACGAATGRMGPHYCPTDETIYLDETFFDVLTEKFGAQGGDVAQAYVIAHEVGHHVQQELGTLSDAQSSNEASIRAELQADCFAGVWAYSLRGQEVFLPGEFEEAIDAAEAVGDDRIQEKTTGRVNPENWTHGSSDERKKWLNVGFDNGDPKQCTP